MDINEINERNIEIFRETGTSNPDEMRYTCVLCGKPACISESYSKRGKNLICWDCKNSKFPDSSSAFKWIEGETENDRKRTK